MEFRLLPNPWSQEIPLVRPLLAVWREEVLDYCRQRDLQPVFDRSNQDTTFFRNRLRHELIPILQGYNPNIKPLLWRMAQVLAGDAEVLDEIGAVAWDVCQARQGDGYVSMDVEALRTQPVGVQRNLLRRAISVLRPGLRDIGFEDVERAIAFTAKPPRTRQRDLVLGLRLFLEGGRIWVAGWEADLLDEGWPQVKKSLDLGVPGDVALPGGWQLRAEPSDNAAEALRKARGNADPFQAWIDPHGLNPTFTIRSRRPGDRFQPLGMDNQTVKLSDLMINLKLPQRARAGWPLVCTAEEVVWVPGYHLAHPYRLTPESLAAVFLQLYRQSEE